MTSKLTVTEAETLAVMLNSASAHMAAAVVYPRREIAADQHAWTGTTAYEAASEMFAGFYAIAPAGVYI